MIVSIVFQVLILWCSRCMVWTCCKCISKYTSWSQLSVHLLSHVSSGTSSITPSIKREASSDQDDSDLCMFCERSCDSHIIKHIPEELLHCAHCDEVFVHRAIANLHIKIVHGQVVFPKDKLRWFVCSICKTKLFRKSHMLRKHLEDQHDQYHFDWESFAVTKIQDITFPCNVCGQPSVLSRTCDKHLAHPLAATVSCDAGSKCNEHSDCHSCQKCDESFDNCKTLWSHMFLNHEDADFICNLCPPGTTGLIKYPYILLKHMGRYHAMNFVIPSVFEHIKTKSQVLVNGVVSFKCVQCPSIVKNFETLKTHMKSHSKESDFVCFVCGKLLSRTNILVEHIRSVHQKIRDFSCHVCKHAFSSVYNLREHMNIHTAIRKHVCEVCGQAFVHKGSLNTHKFSHGTPFTCDYCGKTYANPLSFRRHIFENHTNLPKFVCDMCGKELKTEGNLKKHMLVHSDERPFVCPICNASFKMRKHLRQHQKQRHENKKANLNRAPNKTIQ